MKRSQIKPGQFYLCTVTISDDNSMESVTGEHLLRISTVDDDRVTSFNLTTQSEGVSEELENLLDDDTEAISDDMAERVWRLMLTHSHECFVRAASSVIQSYQLGVESVDLHAGAT
jgi:hypothetical protein